MQSFCFYWRIQLIKSTSTLNAHAWYASQYTTLLYTGIYIYIYGKLEMLRKLCPPRKARVFDCLSCAVVISWLNPSIKIIMTIWVPLTAVPIKTIKKTISHNVNVKDMYRECSKSLLFPFFLFSWKISKGVFYCISRLIFHTKNRHSGVL